MSLVLDSPAFLVSQSKKKIINTSVTAKLIEQRMIGVVFAMIEVHVPRLYPTLSEKDWFTIEKWYVKEGDILQPGDRMVSIECAPGFYDVPTPPEVTSPCRVAMIHVAAGASTHLGELIISLEPVSDD